MSGARGSVAAGRYADLTTPVKHLCTVTSTLLPLGGPARARERGRRRAGRVPREGLVDEMRRLSGELVGLL